jgi:hypothetical protein
MGFELALRRAGWPTLVRMIPVTHPFRKVRESEWGTRNLSPSLSVLKEAFPTLLTH